LGERIATECVDENTWPKIHLSKSGGGKGVRGHSAVRRKGTWFCLVVPDKSGLRMVQLLDDTSHCSSSSYALHMNVHTSHSHVFEALGADQLSRAMR
jgi:hypothetical protein